MTVSTGVRGAATPPARRNPDWFEEVWGSFKAGIAHAFILSGDIDGLAYQDRLHRAILLAKLGESHEVVAVWHLASGGVTLYNEGDELFTAEGTALGTRRAIATRILQPPGATSAPGAAKPGGGVAALAAGVGPQASAADPFKQAAQPLQALGLLQTLLTQGRSAAAGRGNVAVVIDYADALVPAPAMAGKGAMGAEDRRVLVTLLAWAKDRAIDRLGNPVFLLCRDRTELHPDLLTSDAGWRAIDIPPPDRQARQDFLDWYVAIRLRQQKPIALLDRLTTGEIANLTAGLSLRNLEGILLAAYGQGGLTRALLKLTKDRIIAAEYSAVAEMIDPLPGGFRDLGGVDVFRSYCERRIMRPLRQGKLENVPRGLLLVGPPGTGKAQPLDARVLTPTGWRRMGDLVVGDVVTTWHGREARVTGVYPQGMRPIYRVTCSDGATTECCDEHLWATQTRNARRAGGRYVVRPLAEIRRTLLSSDGHPNHTIPLVVPADGDPHAPFPLDPYALGALLGNGHFGPEALLFATGEQEQIDLLNAALPAGSVCRQSASATGRADWAVTREGTRPDNPALRACRALGLIGHKAATKAIPDCYLRGNVAERLALLQGLLDTDGYPGKTSTEFSTASCILAGQVRALVRSLGGTATLATKAAPGYTYRGERRTGQPSYRVTIKLPAGFVPFRLARKVARYRPPVARPPRRAIVAVEPVGAQEARCIAIDSADQLYVTDDYIVTHNTYGVRGLAGEISFTAVALNIAKIMGGIVGESERNLATFLGFCRALAPCIIFVDEFDQTEFSNRGDQSGNPVAKNMFGALLQFMSDETLRGKVIVIFASNRPDKIDPAMKRSGRIDAIVPMLLPEYADRLTIAGVQARAQGVAIDDDALALIAGASENWNAGDLAEIVRDARLRAEDADGATITRAIAKEALDNMLPSGLDVAEQFTRLAVQAVNKRDLLPARYRALKDAEGGVAVEREAARLIDEGGLREERRWE